MASLAINFADQIATFLNGQTVGDNLTLPCIRKLIPERDIASSKTLRAIIVPHSLESKIVARGGMKERIVRIDVGVMKRATESEIEGLLDITQRIGDLLEGKRFDGGICVEVSYAPLYDVDAWLQQQSFVAVVVAKIKVV